MRLKQSVDLLYRVNWRQSAKSLACIESLPFMKEGYNVDRLQRMGLSFLGSK